MRGVTGSAFKVASWLGFERLTVATLVDCPGTSPVNFCQCLPLSSVRNKWNFVVSV